VTAETPCGLLLDWFNNHLLVTELFASAMEGGVCTLKMDGLGNVMMGLADLKMVRQVCIK